MIRKLKGCHKLNHLALNETKVTDGTISKILTGCAELRYLNISTCSQLTEGIVSRLIKSGGNLRHLVTQNLTFLNDAEIQKLTAGLNKLELLDISWNRVTEGALTKINKMKALHTLIICYTQVPRTYIAQFQGENPNLRNILHIYLKVKN